MKNNYNSIIENEGEYTLFISDLFEALLSAKNSFFKQFIQRIKDYWESDASITEDKVSEQALTKYNNMVSSGEWNKKDPLEAKIHSLYTSQKSSDKSSKQKSSKGKQKSNVEEWRKKKIGETKIMDGKTYHWCPHHNRDDYYDGLYMQHDPKDGHKKWQEDKDKRKNNKKKSKTNGASESNSSSTDHSLDISDKLRAALTTTLNLSSDQASDLWDQLAELGN